MNILILICVLEVLCLAEVEILEAWMMKVWQWLNLLIFTHNAYIVTLVDLKTRNILDNPELA